MLEQMTEEISEWPRRGSGERIARPRCRHCEQRRCESRSATTRSRDWPRGNVASRGGTRLTASRPRVQFPASRRKTLFGETPNTTREDAYAPQTPRHCHHFGYFFWHLL
jgi:hypothetical protein